MTTLSSTRSPTPRRTIALGASRRRSPAQTDSGRSVSQAGTDLHAPEENCIDGVANVVGVVDSMPSLDSTLPVEDGKAPLHLVAGIAASRSLWWGVHGCPVSALFRPSWYLWGMPAERPK